MEQQTLNFNQQPLVHRTNHFTPSQSAASKRAAGEQERRVMGWFAENGKGTPDEVHKAVGRPGEPYTSYRRAFTNLTKAGLLVKTDEKVMGNYGKNIHVWRLAK